MLQRLHKGTRVSCSSTAEACLHGYGSLNVYVLCYRGRVSSLLFLSASAPLHTPALMILMTITSPLYALLQIALGAAQSHHPKVLFLAPELGDMAREANANITRALQASGVLAVPRQQIVPTTVCIALAKTLHVLLLNHLQRLSITLTHNTPSQLIIASVAAVAVVHQGWITLFTAMSLCDEVNAYGFSSPVADGFPNHYSDLVRDAHCDAWHGWLYRMVDGLIHHTSQASLMRCCRRRMARHSYE